MSTHKEKLSILSEMIGFAKRDDTVKEPEYHFLLGVASNLGIDRETFNILVRDRDRTHSSQIPSGPYPAVSPAGIADERRPSSGRHRNYPFAQNRIGNGPSTDGH